MLLSAGCGDRGPDITTLNPLTLAVLTGTAAAPIVLDVRSPEEFARGHIPGALHVPYTEVAERISELNSARGMAVYCAVGPRARKAEVLLTSAGYQGPLFHIEGGMQAWVLEGLPVERPSASASDTAP